MLFLEQTQGFAGSEDGAQEASSPPSLFELLMQERMAAGFKPAIEYLTHTLCESYPQLALALPVRRLDETYALLRYCVENYFINRYDSLATEKFYGMKRVLLDTTAGGATTTSPLTPRARKLALLFAVLVPYLKAKLDAYHKQLSERLSRTASSSSSSSPSSRRTEQTQQIGNFLRRLREFQYLRTMQKGFVATYPFAHFAYEGSFFLYQWLYLFGDTPYFSPFLKSMKTILVRVTQDDESVFRQNETMYREKIMEKLGGPGLFDRIRRIALRTTWATLDHSYVLLLLSIAGYKFVEWMYSEEGVATKLRFTGTDAPVPPPPLPPQFSGQALALATMDPTLCPLCKKQRVNPAMVSSGYVFCYPCIYRFVEKHGECPITQMKCDLTSIVKIYDDARDP
ncbi:ubiquitin-protein ligase peroxin 12 [Phytophthora boehmeriae]|uniref:Ubiquitin-protein ligase peroxin 12 n=1 Tax=Phytophthora boehmeriae TaxID=109152 RepID=A0A8T1X2I8_9STRA|nr:ubiquitin-protein ligase peroxin 12 [Phytophthora boehmeriae]